MIIIINNKTASFVYFQLYDRINTKSLSPAKSPPSDSVSRAKEVSVAIF